jgi:hypothetical protein
LEIRECYETKTTNFKEKTMKKKEIESLKMLTRTVDLLSRNVGWFPTTSAVADILKALANGVANLSKAAANSKTGEGAMREASKIRAIARKRLRELISRASLVARALHTEIVRPPAKDTEHELISIGRGFIDSVEPLKKDFIRHALSPDEVLEAVEALEGAILSYTAAKTARSAALNEWDVAMAESLDALLGLDALVANVLRDSPVARASFEAVRSIPHSRGRAVTVAPEPEPAVPAVNAAPA